MDDDIISRVFHPLVIAKGKNFVGRQNLVNEVISSVRTPGAQILLHGAFGSGKTSVAYRVAEQVYGVDPILYSVPRNPLEQDQSIQFLEGVFEAITGFPPSEMVSRKNFAVEWLGIKLNLDGAQQAYRHVMTTPNIAALILKQGRPVVIDNLDRLNDDAFSIGLDLMKQVCDLRSKVQFAKSTSKVLGIAARRDVRALLQADPAIAHRVHTHYVPLLEPSDMYGISTVGFRKLNLEFDRNAVKRIHYQSCRLPRMLHSICLECARNAHMDKERSVGNNIQKALSSLLGFASLEKEYEYVSGLLDQIAMNRELDPDKLLKVAVAAAMRIQDSSNVAEVSALLKSAGSRIAHVDRYLNALLDAKVLELARRNPGESEFRYAFVHYTHQLALRFKISDAELSQARNLRDFELSYDRLYGDGA